MASSVWQLMFLHGDDQAYSLSVSEAKNLGYSLTASAHRLVLRARYKQPQAEIKMVSEHQRDGNNLSERANVEGFTFAIR